MMLASDGVHVVGKGGSKGEKGRYVESIVGDAREDEMDDNMGWVRWLRWSQPCCPGICALRPRWLIVWAAVWYMTS